MLGAAFTTMESAFVAVAPYASVSVTVKEYVLADAVTVPLITPQYSK